MDRASGDFEVEISTALGKKRKREAVHKGILLRQKLVDSGVKIKGIRKSSYYYKDKKDMRATFPYDLRTFLERHQLTRRDFAELIDVSPYNIANWLYQSKRNTVVLPTGIDGIIDIMKRVDAYLENYP